MPNTLRFALPLHDSGTASRETTFNISLLMASAAAARGADDILSAPPGSPAQGAVYIIGPSPSGAWTGKAGKIAVYYSGWYYLTLPTASRLYVRDENKFYTFTGSAWVDLTAAPATLGVGGGLPNSINGFVVKSPASLFNNAGAGHQLKINKNATSDSAEIAFLSAESVRGEFGLRGANNLSFSASPDGSVVNESFTTDASTGITTCVKRVDFADGLSFNGGADILNAAESGSWTPSLTAASGGPVTHSVQTGKYYRQGSECFASFRCQITAKNGIAGNLSISGLPFPCLSGTEFQTGGRPGFVGGATLNSGEKLRVSAQPGNANLNLIYVGLTSGTANATDLKIGNAFHMRCGIVYRI